MTGLAELSEATIAVRDFGLKPEHGPTAEVTHVVTVTGGDRPGLVARLSEVFTQFRANIVRMEAQTLPDSGGSRYFTRFAVWIPASNIDSCLNTVANTAGELGLSCGWQKQV